LVASKLKGPIPASFLKANSAIALYERYYVDIEFEGSGLFEALRLVCPADAVLYQGCFVHITPSFFFSHVVYVDRDPIAREFFLNQESVSRYISKYKKYKRSPYVHFIAQDYSAAVPLADESFDMVISLFAPKAALICKRYLRNSGILLTNDHPTAASDRQFELIAVVQQLGGKYTFRESELGQFLAHKRTGKPTKDHLRRSHRGLRYMDKDPYFVFRKRRLDNGRAR